LITEGIDVDNLDQVIDYNIRKWKHFIVEGLKILQHYHPDATSFCNGTTHLYDDGTTRESITSNIHGFNTHHELEDLPSTWGGYDKLPLRSKFFHTTGKPLLGMSGKFHTSWGEFGGG
jgi:hypothetical protein